MKLSAHDKQRLRWLAAGVAGVAGVLYAYVQLLILPLMTVRDANRGECALLREQSEQARVDLLDAAATRRDYAALQQELDVATNGCVLRPVLGSLLMSAQRLLEPVAQDNGLQVDTCVEKGRVELPTGKSDKDRVFERYAMEITVQGPYQGVTGFLNALERTNAYLCVTDLDIQGRPENPLRHKTTLRLEWPVAVEHHPPSAETTKTAGKPAVPGAVETAAKRVGAP